MRDGGVYAHLYKAPQFEKGERFLLINSNNEKARNKCGVVALRNKTPHNLPLE
jgi:hypothetical protein